MGIFEILKLIMSIINGAKELVSFIEANKNEQWFQDSATTFAEIRKTINDPSLSKEEKSQKYRDTGRAVGDLISRL